VPLENRMTPFGEPIAVEARGLVYANRGCMHDAGGRIRRPYGVKRWIACQLAFRGWHRAPLMQPGRFTELFFLDEATAFAAAHRPCRLCRYEDYRAFVDTWRRIHPGTASTADAIDGVLHEERWNRAEQRQRHHRAALDDLPDGARRLLLLTYSLINVSFPVEAWHQPRVPDSGASTLDVVIEPII